MDDKLEKYIRAVALPNDTQLGSLKVVKILGVGSNGIVYEAFDSSTQRVIALKEYFPVRLAKRNKDLTVEPANKDDAAAFQSGLKSFLDSGIQLSRIKHPNVVQMHKVEEQNNTVYLLMEKIDGPLLSERLGVDNFVAPEIVNTWVEKILNAVKSIHDNGILHLSIEPNNIILNERLGPVLIDFGQLGQAKEDGAQDNPYCAIECNSGNKEQVSKQTDIYAVGALFTHMLSGTSPVPAASRSTAKSDPQIKISSNSALKKIYSSNLLNSIDNAMSIRSDSRYETIDDWLFAISNQSVSESKRSKFITIGLAAVFLSAVTIWLVFGRDYYNESKLWKSLSSDEPCTASTYLSEYENGRYAGEANTRLALCEARRLAVVKKQTEQKQTLIDRVVGSMISINPSCFKMGSNNDEYGRDDDERQHEVCLTTPFDIATHEVTIGQFKIFVEQSQYKTDAERNNQDDGCWALDPLDEKDPFGYKGWASWRNPYKSFPVNDQMPVSCVSPNDINNFLIWLNGIANTEYRLLREAEWEFAARGKSESISRPWGDDPSKACNYANIADVTNIPELTQNHSNTSPWPAFHQCDDGNLYATDVGSYNPNHLGIYDLIGNISELTCSSYSGSYADNELSCASGEENRVDHGGDWQSGPDDSRLATRGDIPYFGRASNIGFRLAKDAR